MLQIPIQPVLMFLLALIRVSFFFAFLPIFGDVFVPARVRILLSVAVAVVFTPLLAARLAAFPQTVPQFVSVMASEALLGMAFGLVGRVLFGAVQFAGEIMSEQIGFGTAGIVDPSQSVQIPLLAEVLYTLALTLFFLVNAHHVFLGALAQSFDKAPPGLLDFSKALSPFFVDRTAAMFVIAVRMSMPVIALIFAVNVAMGMVAKAVPQMNVFLESFPVRIAAGLFLLSVSSALLAKMMTGLFTGLKGDLGAILSAFGG